MRALTAMAAAVTLLMLWGVKGSVSVAQAPTVWTPVAGLPLEDPAQVRPDASGTVSVSLTAAPKMINVSGAALNARPWATNAPGPTSLDGPTIHVRPGGTIKVTFVNGLGAGIPTNIHYHGLHVSPTGIADNIFRTFDNGKTYRSVVHVTDDQATGTYWYHVHMHGLSEGQVMGGLSGLLVIDGLAGKLPRAWRGVRQRQLALRDVQTSGNSIVAQSDIVLPGPSTRLVNALYQPTFTMHAKRYELWRLANIGADVFYKLVFRNRARPQIHARFAVIAEDGEPVWRVAKYGTLLIPPGKRFDVLVAAPDAGTYDLVSLKYAQRYVFSQGPPATLDPKPLPVEVVNGTRVPVDQTLATAHVLPSSRTVPSAPLPKALVPRDDLSRQHVSAAHKRTFRFQYTPANENFAALINGTRFEPTEMPLAAPVRGTLEEWTLINQTTDDHPFHIHVNGFQVISVNGKRYRATGYQDIVDIPAQTLVDGKLVDGKVVIRVVFKRFTGWFVFHCHILQHEDAGMMATIQVRKSVHDPIEPPPEYRHGGGGLMDEMDDG
ncbi:MAG: multicopper oxidase family protein [Solirubrobacterales bacterium]|nr:multicopper oxidase family protein [Solirubrobacterales bacterium]